jgi:hypothetical protein
MGWLILHSTYFPYSAPLQIALSTGTGMISGSSTINSPSTFADINDDGMDDLIVDNYVYKSDGDGTFSDPVYAQHISGESQMAEINGDGRSDFCNQPTSGLYCALANGEIAGDSLESVTNPLGGHIVLTYGNSSEFSNNRIPFILHPVKTIEAYDGIIDDVNNNIDIPVVTSYDYANGYYDYPEGIPGVSVM